MDSTIIIDADAHVEECVETWDYLDPAFADRRPIPVVLEGEAYEKAYADMNAFWLIDGKPSNKLSGPGAMVSLTPARSKAGLAKRYSVGSQELSDVPARLADMDELGVAVQVLFPTLYNRQPADDPQFLTALQRSYNSWLAERCSHAPDRLKWAAVMPLHDVGAAIEELHRTREMGATTALCYPMVNGKTLGDRSLYPFYAEADKLGVPITSHIGWYFPELNQTCDNIYQALASSIVFPLIMSFIGVVGSDILDRFPNLRFGFLEAGATWVLYAVEHMDHYWHAHNDLGWYRPPRPASEWVNSGRIYLTSEPEETYLPQVIDLIGEDHMMMSTDMPHAEGRDSAVDQLVSRADISDAVRRKIFYDNPKRFYGLSV